MQLTELRADRVVLYNISWQQFENLLIDLGESRAARIRLFYTTLAGNNLKTY